ncbi:potassium voltage-gated channel subfamily A member 2-like [Clytia hemisphaerica]|uniref:potassium voltage-gated channel subfamily A member 2-like n=1 Tax=Clytia hemisphaerica TaxID=252671 RepID=UPI0034D51C28
MAPPQRIQFNVSGKVFETMVTTLQQFPDSLLGNQTSRDQFYCKRTNQYFLNRNATCFECILFFYQSKGRLYRPPDIPVRTFFDECQFYELPESSVYILKVKERYLLREHIREKHFPKKYDDNLQMWLWQTLENPSINVGAKCFYIVQTIAIIMSIILSCLESFKHDHDALKEDYFKVELALCSWFFLETLARAIVCPNKFRYFTSLLNWCDIVAVAPHSIIYSYHEETKLLQQTRFVRVLRILRLRKISPRTKAVCLILKDSASDLYLFFFGLLMAVAFGSSTMYHLEMTDPHTNFTSIPQGMWWGMQSFLTVGYGDLIPQTIAGRMFATLFMIVGMDTVLLPVLSLIMKFADFVAIDYLD